MEVSTYTPTGISHATSVDFSKRTINQPVHVVQYDNTLPILAVSLHNNGQLYPLPEDAEINIRLGKPDKTFVYKGALGCSSDRTIAYFEITQQMTVIHGEYYPVIEIVQGAKVACSSSIYIIVDKNPIQEDYIESRDEFIQLVQYRDEAKQYAENAKESADIAVDAKDIVVENADNAKLSADNAKISETNAKTSETNAKISETNAKTSETNAKTSELNAAKSETNAKISETNAKTSETNAKTSELNAAKSETNAGISEANAKTSEDNAEEYSNLSKSYAVGTENIVRDNDKTDNAKYYCNISKTESEKCKTYSDNAENCMNEIMKKVNDTSFTIDFVTGELIQNSDSSFVFSINQNTGNLEWEVAS